MQSVGTRDTEPERKVRRALFAAGYRYRLHRRDLPGSPDIVFASRKKAILVHGCFWHSHGCSKGKAPKSRTEYWGPKLEANKARDARNLQDLRALGWSVLVLWQCEMADPEGLLERLVAFVDGRANPIDRRKPTR